MGEMRWGGGGGRPDLFGGGGRSDTSEWGASCLHVQKAGKKVVQLMRGAYCTICASYNSNYRRRILCNMRLAYAATYQRPGPHELLEAHMAICASHIVQY